MLVHCSHGKCRPHFIKRNLSVFPSSEALISPLVPLCPSWTQMPLKHSRDSHALQRQRIPMCGRLCATRIRFSATSLVLSPSGSPAWQPRASPVPHACTNMLLVPHMAFDGLPCRQPLHRTSNSITLYITAINHAIDTHENLRVTNCRTESALESHPHALNSKSCDL